MRASYDMHKGETGKQSSHQKLALSLCSPKHSSWRTNEEDNDA